MISHTPGTDKNSVNQQGKQKEGIDLFPFSHKAECTQVMGLHINAFEVRKTTYNRNCLACKDLFPM